MKIDELTMFQNLLGKVKGMFGKGSAPGAAGAAGLSREDKMAMDIFTDRFVSRGTNALNVAIKQGLLDPTKASTTAGPGSTPGTKEYDATQDQIAANPAAKVVPKTPEQIRIEKQKAAAAKAQTQMAANPAAKVVPKTPEQIRIEKQKAAAAKAQTQMAAQPGATPASSASPGAAAFGTMAKTLQQPATKARGGKVAGQLSQTPNAVRKRNARAIAKDRDRLIPDYGGANESKNLSESRIEEIYSKLKEETFREKLKRAGHDPRLVAKKIEKILAKHKAQRAEKEEREEKMGLQEITPTAPAQNADKPAIGDWFKKNFMDNFLRGIDISSAKNEVNAILNRMPQSYKQGTLKNDLQDLAMIAWTLSDQGRRKDTN